ncbi:HNH endonuclease [Klebsiella pneumoniae]|uniref:HNH endonuclease n=1 Tax=Klebsiella pneumoniae TaxID=573 RepID=UPI001E58E576|nr:HNH endonuclease signature motif containing protein [Klebsiella pneumoniae]MCD5936996.1 HNH endonuclease [Klebsiella pneumoniae]
MAGDTARVNGRARVTLKRNIYFRDDGRCCLCGCVVSLGNSELDHRIALQFGGTNESDNLWTLCIDCHSNKTREELRSNSPLDAALAAPVPRCIDNEKNRFNLA